MTRIQVTIGTYGTVSGYPKGTYKVAGKITAGKNECGKRIPIVDPLCEAGMLLAHGWTIAKYPRNGSSYFYLTAPNNEYAKRVSIELDVPNVEDILALAERLHTINQMQRGVLDGWPYRYVPYKQEVQNEKILSMAGTRIERRFVTEKAMFDIGTAGVWNMAIVWDEEGKSPRICGHVPANNGLQVTPTAGGENHC